MTEPIAGFAGSVRSHLRNPLYKNAYLLIINQGLSAGLGFIYWFAAARFFSTEVVGKGAAIITTLGLVSALAELSLRSGMQRFVPRAGEHVRNVILVTYTVNLLAAGLLTAGFMLAGRWLHFSDNLFGDISTGGLGLLVVGNMLYTVFIVQDGVLMGLRQSLWVLLENTIYNLNKIVLLVGSISGWFWNGIVASWFLSTPLAVLLVTGLIFWRFVPNFLRKKSSRPVRLPVRQMVFSVTGDHVGTILAEISTRLIPLLVINLLGNSANAFFNQAWLIGSMLYLVSVNISASFTVEGASSPNKLVQLSRQTLRHIMLIIIPLSLALLAAAPFILGIFSQVYAIQGTALLQWLALAAIPYGVNAWFLGYARVRGDSRSIILVQGMQCIITLALSYWWLPSSGIQSIGIAWLVAQSSISGVEFFLTRRLFFGHQAGTASGVTGLVAAEGPIAGLRDDPCAKTSLTVNRDDPPNPPLIRPRNGAYLFLSPHLDDVALSCSGYLYRLCQAGERVLVVSIFTGDLPKEINLSWLASRNLRAWELEHVEQPFSTRCQEDRQAAQILGVESVHLGCLDALFRRRKDGSYFYTRKIVNVPVDPEDREQTGLFIQVQLKELAEKFAGARPLKVIIPAGIGGHVDHILLRDAAQAVFDPRDLVYYEDFPYAGRINSLRYLASPGNYRGPSRVTGQPELPGPKTWVSTRIILTEEEINARVAAAKCYSSQIRGLFPTAAQRNLEILSSHLPWADPFFRSLLNRTGSPETAQRRMERILREYIRRAGGENYWYSASVAVSYPIQSQHMVDAI